MKKKKKFLQTYIRSVLPKIYFETDSCLKVLFYVSLFTSVSYIFATAYCSWNSDFATWQNLAYNMVRTRSLVPSSWLYGSDTFLYFPIPMALLGPLLRDQLLVHSISGLIVLLSCIVSIYVIGRFIFNDGSCFILITIVLLSGFFCEGYVALIYGEHAYLVRVTQIMTVLGLYAGAADSDLLLSDLRSTRSIVFFVTTILLTIQSLTVIQQYIFPLLVAVTVIFLKENFYDAHILKKQSLKTFIKTVVVLMCALLVSVCGNKLIFINARIIGSNYTFVDGEMILQNIHTVIVNGAHDLFGTKVNVALLSVDGLINLFKIVFGISVNFVFPILLVRKFNQLGKRIQYLVVFIVTYVITNIICVLCAFGEFQLGHTRYFLVGQMLLFVLSVYYVNEFIIKKSLLGKWVVYAALFAAVCTYNIPRLALIDDAKHSIQTQRALTTYLRQNDLSYGYASYWHSTNNMVMSNYDVKIFPVFLGERITPFTVLTSVDFYEPSMHEGGTFLLLTDAEAAALPPESMVYGEPARILHYGGYTIYAYDYNLYLLAE